jgi:hypothetical protein
MSWVRCLGCHYIHVLIYLCSFQRSSQYLSSVLCQPPYSFRESYIWPGLYRSISTWCSFAFAMNPNCLWPLWFFFRVVIRVCLGCNLQHIFLIIRSTWSIFLFFLRCCVCLYIYGISANHVVKSLRFVYLSNATNVNSVTATL